MKRRKLNIPKTSVCLCCNRDTDNDTQVCDSCWRPDDMETMEELLGEDDSSEAIIRNSPIPYAQPDSTIGTYHGLTIRDDI